MNIAKQAFGTTAGGESPTPITTVPSNTTTYTDIGLSSGKYYYIVKAVNTVGEGPASSEVSATVGAPELGGGVVVSLALCIAILAGVMVAAIARRE